MDNNRNYWYFENVDFYNIFCTHKVGSMKANHVFKKYSKGEFIYMLDEHNKYVFLISEGRVKLGGYTSNGEEVVKSILGKGEIFGELGVAGEETAREFAKALDYDTVICPLKVEELKLLMKNNENINFAILKMIGLKFRKIERRMESMVFKDSGLVSWSFYLKLVKKRVEK